MGLTFLDTSGLFCALDAEDHKYPQANLIFRERKRFLTHNYVLAEMFGLALARKISQSHVLGFVQSVQTNPRVRVHWVSRYIHQAALALLGNRPDKGYSLCDAVSFLLMKQKRCFEALTTDHHFAQEGFVQLLKG